MANEYLNLSRLDHKNPMLIGVNKSDIEEKFYLVEERISKQSKNECIMVDTHAKESFNQYFFDVGNNGLMRL